MKRGKWPWRFAAPLRREREIVSTGNRVNTLLVELLIVIFFFMLGASVLMQVFGKAHDLSTESKQMTQALAQAQSMADRLYAAEKPADMLAEQGFAPCDDAQMEEINRLFPEADNTDYYELEADGYRLVASVQEPADALEGALRRMQVSIIQDGYIRVTLPCSRYVEDAA